MRTRKTPPHAHTQREREMERKREGPTRFVCWMRATELKIVGEREREREREQESGRGGGRVLCIKD
jgi:hypothetical protein